MMGPKQFGFVYVGEEEACLISQHIWMAQEAQSRLFWPFSPIFLLVTSLLVLHAYMHSGLGEVLKIRAVPPQAHPPQLLELKENKSHRRGGG